MNSFAFGTAILLLMGVLWIVGAIMQWQNLRRQERLIARLRRLAVRRAVRPSAESGTVEVEVTPEELVPAGALRPSRHWTVG